MPADVRVIVGIHECFRKEFASLPLRVKAVPVDDRARADVVGRHVLLMCDLLAAHDRAQAEVVKPLVAERAPGGDGGAVEDAGNALADAVPAVRAQVQAWRDDANVLNRATIHTTLIGFERLLLAQLSAEESQTMPTLADVLSPDDVDALLAAGLTSLPADEVPLAVGMFLEDNTAEVGALVWERLPLPVREDFDASGRAAYADYRASLRDS